MTTSASTAETQDAVHAIVDQVNRLYDQAHGEDEGNEGQVRAATAGGVMARHYGMGRAGDGKCEADRGGGQATLRRAARAQEARGRGERSLVASVQPCGSNDDIGTKTTRAHV